MLIERRLPRPRPVRRAGALRQRGLTLVELMVGIAVGMFVLAGATLMLSSQLGDNRRLLLETQLQQDLRASMDIMTRELRRAGSTPLAIDNLWQAGMAPPHPNTLSPITLDEDGTSIEFKYRREGSREGPWGFRLQDGRIESRLGDSGWQDLTDRGVMEVTAFQVVAEDEAVESLPCAKACSADPDDTACWPTLTTRTYSISIEAKSVQDPNVLRSQSSRVRVRNDVLDFNDPLHPSAVCPS